jgi:hypothetical protein
MLAAPRADERRDLPMTRTMTMYDGVNPDTVPAGAAIYAGYVDGEWQSYDALVSEYPSALHVSICVTSADSARVLDVETGDATPDEAPAWASRQRAGGNPYPVVYMDESNWPSVQSAFSDQGVAAPLYWVAAYVSDPTDVPTIPDGAIALQYYDYGGYDASVAADYWPGLDPAPVTTSTDDEDDDMQIEPLSVHPGEYAFAFAPDKTEMVLVADGYSSPPASLRIAVWTANDSSVLDGLEIGGSSGRHTVGHSFPSGTTGVTVRRLDSEDYPVGITFN